MLVCCCVFFFRALTQHSIGIPFYRIHKGAFMQPITIRRLFRATVYSIINCYRILSNTLIHFYGLLVSHCIWSDLLFFYVQFKHNAIANVYGTICWYHYFFSHFHSNFAATFTVYHSNSRLTLDIRTSKISNLWSESTITEYDSIE